MGKVLRLTPGFRFHPTDVELVLYHLKKKVLGKKFSFEAIADLDIYKHAPWDLPAKSHLPSRDLKWYFFCPREKKYASGVRQNRATDFGYWKTTGRDRPVTQNNSVVGQIKTLIFHRGRPPKGERTDWVIHEYRLQDQSLADKGIVQDSYVLCMVFQKDGPGPRNGAQYGAPFREEDWTDGEEESCTDVGNSSKESVPNSLVVDDDAGSLRVPPRTCIGSPVLCVFDAMVPGPLVPKPSSGGEVGNNNSSANMPCALKSATSSGSPPDYSVSDAVALTCKLQKTLPNNDIKMDKLPDTNDGDILSLLNCFGDDEPFVRTENYKNKDTNNVNQGVAITGAAYDEGVDVYEGLDDLDNSVSHTHKATCTFEEIISIPNYDGNSFLELRDLDAPLAGPAYNEDAQLNILSDGVNNCNTDPGEPSLQVNAVDAVQTSLWPDRAHPLWQYQSDL